MGQGGRIHETYRQVLQSDNQTNIKGGQLRFLKSQMEAQKLKTLKKEKKIARIIFSQGWEFALWFFVRIARFL